MYPARSCACTRHGQLQVRPNYACGTAAHVPKQVDTSPNTVLIYPTRHRRVWCFSAAMAPGNKAPKRKAEQAGLADVPDPMDEDRVSSDSNGSEIVPADVSVRQSGLVDRCGMNPDLPYKPHGKKAWRDLVNVVVDARNEFNLKYGEDPAMGTTCHAQRSVSRCPNVPVVPHTPPCVNDAGIQKKVAKINKTPIAAPKTFSNAQVVWKEFFTKDIQHWQVRGPSCTCAAWCTSTTCAT